MAGDDRAAPAAHVWAAELVRDWNEGALDRIAARLSPDVVVEAPVRKSNAPPGILLSGKEAYIAAFPHFRESFQRLELVSALADEASASLVLRDEDGTLLTVLLAFDDEGRCQRITSYARAPQARQRRRTDPDER